MECNQAIWFYFRHLIKLLRNSMFYVASASSKTLFRTGARDRIQVTLTARNGPQQSQN